MLPVPSSMRPWWSAWWVPLLKPVAAVAGDTVCHLDHVLYVNGASYGAVLTAAHGRPLPHLAPGCQVVPAGSIFLASPVARSLDSRYFGVVPLARLRAVAIPVLTW